MRFVITIALLPSLLVDVNAETLSYRANIVPLSTASTTPASGFVTLFTDDTTSIIGYAGIVTNVEPNLLASQCNATNGCGVHIHSGRSCFNVTTQLGHYWNNASFPIDPWIEERYSSDATGKTNFHSILQIGTVDIEGRAFIVHSFNGTRIGCGIIERVRSGALNARTTNLTASGVTSKVVVQQIQDTACYFGEAKKLEPNLVSFLNKNQTLMGMNCNFTNGCGVHLHNGISCFNVTTQGGHYYNSVTYPIDPWLFTMYHSTNQNGDAYFTGCVETGVTDFVNRPFVIHSNTGSRVSCGLLRNESDAFILINPTTDLPIGQLKSTIDYSSLSTPTLNIMAKFVEPYKSARVTFDNPRRTVCEKVAPFSVFGDNKGNFAKAVIPVGDHKVTAVPYTEDNCAGVPGKKIAKSFTVEGCKLQFIGRAVSNNTEVFRLQPLTVAKTPESAINIEAIVTCGFRINVVQFVLRDISGNNNIFLRRQTEQLPPYFVYGNRGTNIRPGRKFTAGSFSLSTTVNEIFHGTFNFTLN